MPAPEPTNEVRKMRNGLNRTPPIFDGHNDVLLNLYLPQRGGNRSFFERSTEGHIDLPRAQEGAFGGGFFAVFVPPDPSQPTGSDWIQTEHGYESPLPPPLDLSYAQRESIGICALLFRLERES